MTRNRVSHVITCVMVRNIFNEARILGFYNENMEAKKGTLMWIFCGDCGGSVISVLVRPRNCWAKVGPRFGGTRTAESICR